MKIIETIKYGLFRNLELIVEYYFSTGWRIDLRLDLLQLATLANNIIKHEFESTFF